MNNKIFLWIICLFAAFGANTSYAVDSMIERSEKAAAEYRFIVWLKDERNLSFLLTEKPWAKYENNQFKIIYDKGEMAFDVEEVVKFSLCDSSDGSGVEELNGSFQPSITYKDNVIYITGDSPGGQTCIYDINGRLEGVYDSDSNGESIISMANFSSGIYIIKSQSITFKIMIK